MCIRDRCSARHWNSSGKLLQEITAAGEKVEGFDIRGRGGRKNTHNRQIYLFIKAIIKSKNFYITLVK